MPIQGERLIVEPSYLYADVFRAVERDPELNELGGEAIDAGYRIRGCFWSTRWRSYVSLVQCPDGKVRKAFARGSGNQVDKILRTMGCSEAWGLEQEHNALQLLATLLPHHMFRRYLLTGVFLETSKRSGVVYVFRKLRPTIAIRPRGDELKFLCTLCLHPIAYYEDSWAGAMCPTDDVIAHLMMMRGDEVMFWRRSNQHGMDRPESGL